MSPLAAAETEKISGSVHCQTNIYTSLGQGKGPTITTHRAYWGQLFKQNSQGLLKKKCDRACMSSSKCWEKKPILKTNP